jgi:hypothetical protein
MQFEVQYIDNGPDSNGDLYLHFRTTSADAKCHFKINCSFQLFEEKDKLTTFVANVKANHTDELLFSWCHRDGELYEYTLKFDVENQQLSFNSKSEECGDEHGLFNCVMKLTPEITAELCKFEMFFKEYNKANEADEGDEGDEDNEADEGDEADEANES